MKNGKKNSIKIGTFAADKKGVMHGKIYGLGLGIIPVTFEPQTSKEGKSYLRLFADEGYEIGAAFPREANGLNYHSVSLDSPMLPAPVNAALFPDKENIGTFNLVWNRQDEQKDLKAEATVNVNVQQPQQTQQAPGRRAASPTLAL